MTEDPCNPSLKNSLKATERRSMRFLTAPDVNMDEVASSIVDIDELRERTKCDREPEVAKEWKQSLGMLTSHREGKLDKFIGKLEGVYDDRGVDKRFLRDIGRLPREGPTTEVGPPTVRTTFPPIDVEQVRGIGSVTKTILKGFNLTTVQELAALPERRQTEVEKRLQKHRSIKPIAVLVAIAKDLLRKKEEERKAKEESTTTATSTS